MYLPDLNTYYVSETDVFLQSLEKKCSSPSGARKNEEEKFRRIITLRDDTHAAKKRIKLT